MLQIAIDNSIKDKNRDLFVSALRKECVKQKIDCSVVNVESETVYIDIPYIVAQPLVNYPVKFKAYDSHSGCDFDCDYDVTAASIMGILPTDPQNILVIGRGKVVGGPLIEMLLEQTNHAFMVANSKTDEYRLGTMIAIADIIIDASGTNAKEKILEKGLMFCSEKMLIDCGSTNTEYNKYFKKYYSMRDIGAMTVESIVDRAKNIIERNKKGGD